MRVYCGILAFALILSGAGVSAQGQTQPMGPTGPGAGVGFRNDLKVPVIVQGVSLVNNMPRRGQPILIQPGKTHWDNNLPQGFRFYTVYDANQSRILLKDARINVQTADQYFVIRLSPSNQVAFQQEAVPKTKDRDR